MYSVPTLCFFTYHSSVWNVTPVIIEGLLFTFWTFTSKTFLDTDLAEFELRITVLGKRSKKSAFITLFKIQHKYYKYTVFL